MTLKSALMMSAAAIAAFSSPIHAQSRDAGRNDGQNTSIAVPNFEGSGYLNTAGGDNLGNHTATGDLDLSGFRVLNLADPSTGASGATQAANRRYVDGMVAQARDNLGNHTALTNLNISGFRIVNVAAPINAQDVTNKAYVDTLVAGAGDDLGNHTATTILNMASFRISNLADPTQATDGANKRYVDTAMINARDNLGNHRATQALVMGGNVLTGLPAPTNDSDAATKKYVDDQTYDGPENPADSRVRIIAGTGLQGGGDLTQDRTISFNTTWGDARYALRARSLTAGTGISGGGDLSANRTFSFDTAWGDGRYALRARTVSAGTGLQGGGDLSANRTISFNSAWGDARYVTAAGAEQRVTGVKQFTRHLYLDNDGSQGVYFRTNAGVNRAYIGNNKTDNSVQIHTYDESGTNLSSLRIRGSDGAIYPSGNGFFHSNGRRIVSVATPQVGSDAATKAYVDGRIAGVTELIVGDNLGDHTATQILNMALFRVVNLANPVESTDAVNKAYVDAQVGGRALATRAINTGTGLQGGGNLTQDRTISFNTTWGDGRYALRARTVSAGTGLQGGGDLSANRTISFNTTWGDGRYALRARTVSAGTGLQGGGSLAADRTISFNTTWGDNRYVGTSGDQRISGGKQFTTHIYLDNDNNQGISFRTNGRVNRAFIGSYKADSSIQLHTYDATGALLASLRIRGSDGAIYPTGTGFFHSNGKRIVSVGTPQVASDAATKGYVDGLVGGRALATRAINTGTGLQGGGDLTANRTISFNTTWGDARYVVHGRTITAGTGLQGGGTLAANRTISFSTSWGDARYVVHGRTITAGTGLQGGGTLAANRTISFNTTWGDGRYALRARAVNTGTGLQGGGDLSANRTIQLRNEYIRREAGTASQGVMAFNGHASAVGQFYGGTTNPTQARRLNYGGYFYATRFYSAMYLYFSDENMKEDIFTIAAEDGMETVRQLRPVSYAWKENGEQALGVIAQEVEEIIPTAVKTSEDGTKAVDYVQMIAPMLAAIQDLDARVKALEGQ